MKNSRFLPNSLVNMTNLFDFRENGFCRNLYRRDSIEQYKTNEESFMGRNSMYMDIISEIYRKSMNWLERKYEKIGFTPLQASILQIVVEARRIRQDEVVKRLAVDKSVVSKAVGTLVSDGYIRKRPSKQDKRVHILSPTEFTKDSLYPRLSKVSYTLEKTLTQLLDPQEEDQLHSLMEKVQSRLDLLEWMQVQEEFVSYDSNQTADISPAMWEAMKNVDIRFVDKSTLVDLNDVVVDNSKPVPERIRDFVTQIKNPYCFRMGDVVVKIRYKENGPTFQEAFDDMLWAAYRGR